MTNEEKLAAALAAVNAAYDELLAAIFENQYSRKAADCYDAWREAGMVYEHACDMYESAKLAEAVAVADDWEDHVEWQHFHSDPPAIG